MGYEIVWTKEAEALLDEVPFFVRGMVERKVEKAAAAEGKTEVTAELMKKIRMQERGE